MSAPKPRPSAWMCPAMFSGVMCGRILDVGEPYCWHCLVDPVALWGYQWALVAWMAEDEKRKGALYQWLDGLRTLADEKNYDGAAWLRDQFDTAPEDAMQILAVNL